MKGNRGASASLLYVSYGEDGVVHIEGIYFTQVKVGVVYTCTKQHTNKGRLVEYSFVVNMLNAT